MTHRQKLYARIENLRSEIHELINLGTSGLTSGLMVQKSHELDLCILEYQQLHDPLLGH